MTIPQTQDDPRFGFLCESLETISAETLASIGVATTIVDSVAVAIIRMDGVRSEWFAGRSIAITWDVHHGSPQSVVTLFGSDDPTNKTENGTAREGIDHCDLDMIIEELDRLRSAQRQCPVLRMIHGVESHDDEQGIDKELDDL